MLVLDDSKVMVLFKIEVSDSVKFCHTEGSGLQAKVTSNQTLGAKHEMQSLGGNLISSGKAFPASAVLLCLTSSMKLAA